MSAYILVVRDTTFWLVGPFKDDAAASTWGHDPENNPEQDPRWHTVELNAANHKTHHHQTCIYSPGLATWIAK